MSARLAPALRPLSSFFIVRFSMHTYHLLEILAVGFGAALLFGYLAQRARLSPIVGYLAAGFLIGPLTPGFVADADLANNLAEAGIILLMFGVGLHFHTDDLMSVKGIAIPGAAVQATAAAVFGIVAAMGMGYSLAEGVFLGLGLSVASTVVLLRVLTDAGRLETHAGTVAVGWLVVEDIFTVLMLVLLPAIGPSLASGSSLSIPALLWAVCMAAGKLLILWVVVMTAGSRVVPWALKQIVRTRSHELFTLTVLSAAFLTALAAAYIFDASFALGAFLGGMVVGKSKVSHQAGAELIPLRDAFSVLFFLSVGMLFDPVFLLERPGIVILSMAIVLLVKPAATIGIIALLGGAADTAFTVAAGLAQVGEFSFILAQTGLSLSLISEDIYSVLIVCALVSIAANPFLMRAVPAAEAEAKRHPRLWRLLNCRAEAASRAFTASSCAASAAHCAGRRVALIAGYGPTGRAAAKAASARGFTPVVLEMNMDTVAALEQEGKAAVYGDITKEDILKAAGAERAEYFIITIPSAAAAAEAAITAKELNPSIRVVARTRFLQDQPLLKDAGADYILYEESAVSRELADLIGEIMEKDSASAAGDGAVPSMS